MANEENLIPWNKRTESEQREYARRGGKKSGEVRRQRKAMKEQMEMLLSLPFKVKDSKGNDVVDSLEFLGIDKENIDNQMAIIISLWKTAMNSNSSQQINAVREIREIVKDDKDSKESDLENAKEVLIKIREVAENDKEN